MTARPLKKHYLLAFALGVLALFCGCAEAEDPPLRGTISWIYDGDTLKVDGIGKVRLIGIDTPEKDDSKRDRYLRSQGVARARLRAVAKEALRFNIATVKGQNVVLQPGAEQRDRHGRLLAYVVLSDGRMLNRLLIEKGYAVVYRRFDFSHKDDFLHAEAEARRNQVGLWRP